MKTFVIYILLLAACLSACRKNEDHQNSVTAETIETTEFSRVTESAETLESQNENNLADEEPEKETLEPWIPEDYIDLETQESGAAAQDNTDEVIFTETRPDGLVDVENGAGWG